MDSAWPAGKTERAGARVHVLGVEIVGPIQEELMGDWIWCRADVEAEGEREQAGVRADLCAG